MTRAEQENAEAAAKLRKGLAGPDAFFRERGMTLSCSEADGFWWAGFSESASRYGRGSSEEEAKLSAVRRWMAEQEAPDLRRQPGEPLP